jgi:cytochrome oxidase Cu insertion factor (SCO1/SenC/PrrC family)
VGLVAAPAATPSEAEVSRARLAALAAGLAAASGIALGVVVHAVTGNAQSGLELPELHGQASWSPGERRAPAIALRDHRGALVRLEALHGKPVLLTFLDSRCRAECPLEGRQLSAMLRRMAPAERPVLLVVSVDPAGDTPASIRSAAEKWRLDGPYRWHWLRGSKGELAPVWRDYGITVRPADGDITHALTLYLIDRRGFERTGYLYPFLPNFVALDLRTLAREPARS